MDEGVKVSVAIVCRDGGAVTETCLYAVTAATFGMEAELFVTDNASADNAAAYLAPLFPDIEFFREEETRPEVQLHEAMFRKAAGEYFLVLDAGVVVGEDLIRTLCYFMDENPDVGAAGPKVLDVHGAFVPESKRCLPTPWISFCRKTWLSSLFPTSARFNAYYLPYLDADRKHRVEVVSDSFRMLRRTAIEKAGWPVAAEMQYEEEIEMAYRLAGAGFKSYYLPERVLHYGKGKPMKKTAHRRLLVIAREANIKEMKSVCEQQMPGWEYVHAWNLDEQRILGAASRSVQMKGFTDIAVCYPDASFEQLLLLMDRMENKYVTYHIYNRKNKVLVSPQQ